MRASVFAMLFFAALGIIVIGASYYSISVTRYVASFTNFPGASKGTTLLLQGDGIDVWIGIFFIALSLAFGIYASRSSRRYSTPPDY